MAAHPLNRVVVIPLWLAPWVLTVIVMDIFSGLAANALVEQFMDRLTEEMGLVAGPLAACTLIAVLACGACADIKVTNDASSTRVEARPRKTSPRPRMSSSNRDAAENSGTA